MLRKLYAKGLISPKPLLYFEYSNKVKQLIQSGMNKTRAVRKVAAQARVHERTIYRACKSVT